MDHSGNSSAATAGAAVDSQQRRKSTCPFSTPEESTRHVGFSDLRGVRWRTNLGILPSLASSIDEFRRAAADSRRSYAALRRLLLVDPYFAKGGNRSNDLTMDNPLSQNPDSPWLRFFNNAELEKMVDQDLSRLYPEQGSYFQTSSCQAMLRRILLLWCVNHPQCGYKQGMHELLAPLLYVLHVDLLCLSELQKRFTERFSDDACQILEMEIPYNKFPEEGDPVYGEDEEHAFQRSMKGKSGLGDLDTDTWNIVLSSEPYGVEGELGAVLSKRFMEHDGYSIFDSLMSGPHGAVSMGDFFSNVGPNPSLSPVIEGSSALYHILSTVDSSLHDHLVGLGVEPQYFALRWLRVLFAREFSLENLLVIWDEIFSTSNSSIYLDMDHVRNPSFKLLSSPRGRSISAIAVCMLLHLRSSLLATENATSCLQKLLNFPENINVREMIKMAKTVRILLAEGSSTIPSPYHHPSDGDKNLISQGFPPSCCNFSSKEPLHATADNFWEEKWRVLNEGEKLQKESTHDPISGFTKKFHSGRLSLSGMQSITSPFRNAIGGEDPPSLVRGKSSDDLTLDDSHVWVVQAVNKNLNADANFTISDKSGDYPDASIHNNGGCDNKWYGSAHSSGTPTTETRCHNVNYNWSCDSENSSSSCCFNGDKDEDTRPTQISCNLSHGKIYKAPADDLTESPSTEDHAWNQTHSLKENRTLPLKFPWLWRFGRSSNGRNQGKGGSPSLRRLSFPSSTQKNPSGLSVQGHSSSEKSDAKVIKMELNLKNLGQAMKEHIEILETFFSHDHALSESSNDTSTENTGVSRKSAAAASLNELERIGRLLLNT